MEYNIMLKSIEKIVKIRDKCIWYISLLKYFHLCDE